ncbi:MAG: DUF1270 family protein [Sphingobacteriaceae bacterium]|nr:MAG: DUF1270 family protein [Sphingobacteriaceae bacterium]
MNNSYKSIQLSVVCFCVDRLIVNRYFFYRHTISLFGRNQIIQFIQFWSQYNFYPAVF